MNKEKRKNSGQLYIQHRLKLRTEYLKGMSIKKFNNIEGKNSIHSIT